MEGGSVNKEKEGKKERKKRERTFQKDLKNKECFPRQQQTIDYHKNQGGEGNLSNLRRFFFLSVWLIRKRKEIKKKKKKKKKKKQKWREGGQTRIIRRRNAIRIICNRNKSSSYKRNTCIHLKEK